MRRHSKELVGGIVTGEVVLRELYQLATLKTFKALRT